MSSTREQSISIKRPQGRPKGSKNRPGARKPGPRPQPARLSSRSQSKHIRDRDREVRDAGGCSQDDAGSRSGNNVVPNEDIATGIHGSTDPVTSSAALSSPAADVNTLPTDSDAALIGGFTSQTRTQDNLPRPRLALALTECHRARHQVTGDVVTSPSHLNLAFARDVTEATDREFGLDVGRGTPGGDSALAEEEVMTVAQGIRDAGEITIGVSAEESPMEGFWSPPKGQGLGSELRDGFSGGDDEGDAALGEGDDNEDVSYLFGGGVADSPAEDTEDDEFGQVPDDDEIGPIPNVTKSTGGTKGQHSMRCEKAVPQGRSAMPKWLSDDYADTRERLTEEVKRNVSRRTTCYDRGTFVDGMPFPFFSADRKFQPTPYDFYRPSYFVWLPHLLVRQIPCPSCSSSGRKASNGDHVYLRLKGWPKAPRRIVDLDKCIYIIGYRYSCGNSNCNKTYQSWSPALRSVLPPSLSASFTHHLTYRSGLTDRVVALMRASFQHGVGPGPFSETIRTFHLRRYEQLQLQYLEMVCVRLQSATASMMARFEPFGLFDDRDGYAGFTPSPKYFRDFYVNYISSHASEMDQYMAMLSAKVLIIDASYKVIRHLGKVHGQVTFAGGINTAVNEYTEVRSMALGLSKAHHQYVPALTAIPKSLETYGHEPLEIVYTDNVRGDKAELEAVLPELKRDVVPVPDRSSLQTLTVPSEWKIIILSSTYQINTRLNSIMDDRRDGEDMYVAIGMEWSVDRVNGIQGRIALLSIAYDSSIFLLPLSPHWHEGHLPSGLLAFLRASRIKKVGVRASSDLARLFKDCQFPHTEPPFVGALNLGPLAKSKNATTKASVGLVDLTATVLRQYLPKDPAIQVSTAWDSKELSQAQIDLVSTHVYATWSVFQSLSSSTSFGETVSDSTPAGVAVSLFSADLSRVVALGHITPDRPKKHLGVNVTKTRVLVTITEIKIPGYIVPGELLSTTTDTAFSKFPPTPFNLLCKAKHVRTRRADPHDSPSPSGPSDTPVTVPVTSNPLPHASSSSATDDPISVTSNEPKSTESPPWYQETDSPEDSDQLLSASVPDPHCLEQLRKLTERFKNATTDVMRARVLGDIWHLMDQFPISMSHGLRRPFARALRDAFYLLDPEDKVVIEAFLAAKNVSWDSMLRSHPKWLFQRVKRFVPPPEELLPRVSRVIQVYGPLKDAKTGLPLFNEKAWEIAENVLENIRRGYYSDPPNIKLYFNRGLDKYGLMRYKCFRGTSSIEGGVHQNIIRWFGAFNASPEFALELLRDYCLYHNLKVGTLNRTGSSYSGSFDIWTKNRISHLLDITATNFTSLPPTFGPGGWVNGNNFVRSAEVFGLLPLPEELRDNLGMHPFHAGFSRDQKIRHCYLAMRQNTRVTVLPIHTHAERSLFKLLLSETQGAFSGRKEPKWRDLAVRWSSHANGTDIFYKLPEHLKNYWKTWGDYTNEKNSISINQTEYDAIQKLLAPSARSAPSTSVPAAQPHPISHQVNRGIAAPADEVSQWQVSKFLGRHALHQSSVQYTYGDRSAVAPTAQDKGKKRALPKDIDDAPIVSKRKPRTCTRCKRADCDGRFRGRNCSVPTEPPNAHSATNRGVRYDLFEAFRSNAGRSR